MAPEDSSPPSSPHISTVRRRSILKRSDDSTDSDSLGSGSPRNSRRRSMPGLACDDDGQDRAMRKPTRRRVSFTSVEVREHHITLGDHPEVSSGPPICLDWKVRRRSSIDLEEYERDRCPRKTREMSIPPQERHMLLMRAGHTSEEVRRAAREAKEAKNKRRLTIQKLDRPISKAEELLRRVSRKMKTIVLKRRRHRKKLPVERKSASPSTAVELSKSKVEVEEVKAKEEWNSDEEKEPKEELSANAEKDPMPKGLDFEFKSTNASCSGSQVENKKKKEEWKTDEESGGKVKSSAAPPAIAMMNPRLKYPRSA